MGKLIIIRHGQSIWNKENLFTGWEDIPLSTKGVREAKQAGKILKKIKFDMIFTSNLIRAQQTLFEILKENEKVTHYLMAHDDDSKMFNKYLNKNYKKENYVIIRSNNALNERHYGDLQGFNKEEMAKKVGEEQVKIWRRSYDVPPPNGESLKDTYKRTIPYFKKNILKHLKDNKTILIAAHGNSLRAIIKHIENVSDNDIPNYELKTGVPIQYNFNSEGKMTSKRILKFSTLK